MYRPQTTAAEGNITTKVFCTWNTHVVSTWSLTHTSQRRRMLRALGQLNFSGKASAPEDPFGLDAFLNEVKSGK